MLAYIEGTNFVTKHNVTRHLEGKAHSIALEVEAGKDKDEQMPMFSAATAASRQPKITSVLAKSSTAAYRKMISTAYEMAINPTMPMKHFKVSLIILFLTLMFLLKTCFK